MSTTISDKSDKCQEFYTIFRAMNNKTRIARWPDGENGKFAKANTVMEVSISPHSGYNRS